MIKLKLILQKVFYYEIIKSIESSSNYIIKNCLFFIILLEDSFIHLDTFEQ
jgi:hypothetical protein